MLIIVLMILAISEKCNVVKSYEWYPAVDKANFVQDNEVQFMPVLAPAPVTQNNVKPSSLESGNVMLKFNNTIRNVNIIKMNRLRPKRKGLRRCTLARPRETKLFNGSRSRTRFLEVFQVVEFDHVVCISSTGLEGTCLHAYECQSTGGIDMGSCADGYGTCCVKQVSCDERTSSAMGWFVNPGFPSPSTERLSCSVTLDKTSQEIKQIRLDFVTFELLPPSAGLCDKDQFVVSGQNVNNVLPILCGINTAQHVYIEVGNSDGPIYLSVQTESADNRLFSIKFTQLTWADELAAPSGCLQFFKETEGHIESFNYRDSSIIGMPRYPSYLNNFNYAMCIERASDSCSVTFSNVGNMQILNYDTEGLPVIPPDQAGVEIFNCPSDWLLISATRLCGERLNDGSVLQDFAFNAPITDTSAGPITVWFRSDESYVGRGFRLQYKQNACSRQK